MTTRFPRILVLACLVAIVGCSSQDDQTAQPFNRRYPTSPATPVPEAPPIANSAVAAVRALEWSFDHRSFAVLFDLLPEDFEFKSDVYDSFGSHRWASLTREDFLKAALHLFELGTADLAPATHIDLELDPHLYGLTDARPGKTYPWHEEIYTRYRLRVDAKDGSRLVTGDARFYVVRGDSALIPPELLEQGRFISPTEWYVESIVDVTFPVSPPTTSTRRARPLEAQPARTKTWGDLMLAYR